MTDDLKLCPLAGYSTATLPQNGAMLVVEFFPDEAALMQQQPKEIRLAMTRDQARELGEAVLRMADAPHIELPPTDSRH